MSKGKKIMNTMSYDADIIIQGAGPTGCVSALLAVKCGLKVVLIDHQSADDFRGNAHYLNAYSLEILAQCGVNMAALLAQSTPEARAFAMALCSNFQQVHQVSHLFSQSVVADRYDQVGGYGGAVSIPFSLVYQALLTLLSQQGVAIYWRSEIIALDHEAHEVTILHQGQHETMRCAYLLGCDGASSGVCQLLSLSPKVQHHQKFINVTLEADLGPLNVPPALLYWILDPAYPGCYVAHQEAGVHNLQIPLFAEGVDWGREDNIHHYLRQIYGTSRVQYRILHSRPWHMATHVVSQMSQHDWCFLLGDSAHALTPAGGLGLNTGLADAANLIWKLAFAREGDKQILSTYHQERHPVAQHMVTQSICNYRGFASMGNAAALPVDWAYRAPNMLQPMAWPQGLRSSISACYQGALRAAQNLPWLKDRFLAGITEAMTKNLDHFDGMGSHLGYDVRSYLVINDQVLCHDAPGDYDPSSLRPGKLWLYNRCYKAGQSLRHLIDYRWTVLLSDRSQQASWKPQVQCYYLEDFTHEAILPRGGFAIIRPDSTVAYLGTFADVIWRQQLGAYLLL